MDEWLRLQARTQMSTELRCAFLVNMALQFYGGNRTDANSMLLACISKSEPVLRPPVRALSNVNGRISSAGDPGCQYGFDLLSLAMGVVVRAWDTHDGGTFPRVHDEFVVGEPEWYRTTAREFRDDAILMLGQCARYNNEDMAHFVEIACLCRMLVTHLADVL